MYFKTYSPDQLGPTLAGTIVGEGNSTAQSILAYLENCTEGGDGIELVTELLALCTPQQAVDLQAFCTQHFPE